MSLLDDYRLYDPSESSRLNTNTYINNTAPINVSGTVSISGVGGNAVNVYNEAAAVAASIETLVVSYTVPLGKKLRVNGAHGAGIVDTLFAVKKNTDYQSKKRNSWCERNVNFNLLFDAVAGDTVSVYATHGNLVPQNFEANIFGILDDA